MLNDGSASFPKTGGWIWRQFGRTSWRLAWSLCIGELLLSGSVFEVWLLSHHQSFNRRRRRFSTGSGDMAFDLDLDFAIGVDFSDSLLRICDRLQRLKLDETLTALVKAFVLLFTGIRSFYLFSQPPQSKNLTMLVRNASWSITLLEAVMVVVVEFLAKRECTFA